MALTPEQQAIELIGRAKRILIVTKEQAPIDAIASVASCAAFLSKQNRPIDALISNLDPQSLPPFFQKAIEGVMPQVGPMRHLELNIDVNQTELKELFYDIQENKLTVTIFPKSGEWEQKDINVRASQDRYDLVIALDCQDLSQLGSLFREHADFLYRTPIINIDRDPGNEHWGQVNLVDLTAVSTTEVLYRLFESWNRAAFDADLATWILTGMIAKTQSFRTMNVTPKTLQTTSQLIAMGARREEIVHGLWRTKTVPKLKIWGHALSRLEQDTETGLVWTHVTRQDFLEAQTDDHALEGLVQELIAYSPEAKIIVLFYENEQVNSRGTGVIVYATPPYSAIEISRIFGAQGNRESASFNLTPGQTLSEGINIVIERLKKNLKG